MDSIETWLAALGLEKYASAFRDQEVGPDQIAGLTDADLKEIGLPLGPRKRILEAAAKGLPASPSRFAPAADRRQLTIMFVDLVGSTALSGRLDPEDLRVVLRSYHEVCAAAITRWGGLVAKLMGDGVLAYFGWPEASESSAERAIRAGLDINARVAGLSIAPGEAMAARTGIATGPVVVGDLIGDGAAQEAAVAGETPNLAARLQASAEPGGLVVSAATLALAGAHFETEAMPPLHLKGISGSVQAHVVKAVREVQTRFSAHAGSKAARLLGRDQELALLLDRYRRARSGEGQVVVLTAEAGMGKSRLADATVKQIAAQGDACVVWQCAPFHTATAFHPVLRGLTPDSMVGLPDATRQALAALSDPALAGPGLTPAQARHQTLSALGEWVKARSRSGGAAVLLVEDAHWIDPSTLEALEANIGDWARAAVFVLVTARPSFQSDLGRFASVTALSLGRLDKDGAAELAVAAAGGYAFPEEVLAEIAAKSEGVPLFVEEMAKALVASGAIALRDGAWTLVRPLAQGGVPSSLADGLMSRLDKLSAAKEIAQEASVIGRSFSYSSVATLSGLATPKLIASLERLCEEQILSARGDPPDAEFTFSHALLRDAAYESLLKSRRTQLHAKLLRYFDGRPETPVELLAWHAQAAGDRPRAFDLWRKAGEAAMARPAFREAISHFRQALTLASDAEALQVETRLGLAAIAAQGHSHPDTISIFEGASRNRGLTADPASAFVVWYGLWCGHHVRGEAARARDSARALHAASIAEGSPANVMMGVRALGISALMSGDADAALARHREAEAMEDIPRDRGQANVVGQDQSVSFRSYYGLALWLGGQVRRGWSMIEDSVRFARAGGHPGSLGYGLTHAILAAIGMGQNESARAWNAELLEKADFHRLGMWRDYAVRFQRLLDIETVGAQAIAASRTALERRGVGLFSAFIDVAAAERLLDSGDAGAARECLDAARRLLGDGREAWAIPEAMRIEARLAAAEGNTANARLKVSAAYDFAAKNGLWALALKAAVYAVELAGPSEKTAHLATMKSALAKIDAPLTLPGLKRAHEILAQG